MINPLCPFCAEPTERISDNLAYEAWGCVPCGAYINRRKNQLKPDGITKVSEIKLGAKPA